MLSIPMQSAWTSELKLNEPGEPMACFRVMDEKAHFRLQEYKVKHDDETLKRMYTNMVQLNEMVRRTEGERCAQMEKGSGMLVDARAETHRADMLTCVLRVG